MLCIIKTDITVVDSNEIIDTSRNARAVDPNLTQSSEFSMSLRLRILIRAYTETKNNQTTKQ